MRKGPKESASLFSVRTKKKGNDGKMWIIVKNKNGVKRWQKKSNKTSKKSNKTSKKSNKTSKKSNKTSNKTSKKSNKTSKKSLTGKKYLIFDNGGRPYKVVIKVNGLDIFTYEGPDENGKIEIDDTVLIKSYRNLKKIFVPKGIDDRGDPWTGGTGNTILAQISRNRYLFIGPWIYEFETKDQILEYHSQVGNSGVPYPLAVGEKNVYFLIEKGED